VPCATINLTTKAGVWTTPKIPVSCVEQGRWRHVSTEFSAGMYAPPQMRSNKSRQVTTSYKECGQAVSNQSEVWQNVEEMTCSLRTVSPTGAMKDAFDQRAADFDSYIVADKQTGQSKGYGFVVMGIDDQAQSAIQALDGKKCSEFTVKVQASKGKG